jgi:hypothetical protein
LEIATSSGCIEHSAEAILSRTDTADDFDTIQGCTLMHFAACDMVNQTILRKLLEKNAGTENRIMPARRRIIQQYFR